MSPELVEAIRARIEHGFTREQIREEVLAAGHEEDVFEAAYAAAGRPIPSAPAPEEVASTQPASSEAPTPPPQAPAPPAPASPSGDTAVGATAATHTAAAPGSPDASARSPSSPQGSTERMSSLPVLLTVGGGVMLGLIILAVAFLGFDRTIVSWLSGSSGAPFDEEQILSELSTALRDIEQIGYEFRFETSASAREADATPPPEHLLPPGAALAALPPQVTATNMVSYFALRGAVDFSRATETDAAGSVAFGIESPDMTMHADVAYRFVHDAGAFVKVDRMPPFFGDLSPIRGTWVRLIEPPFSNPFAQGSPFGDPFAPAPGIVPQFIDPATGEPFSVETNDPDPAATAAARREEVEAQLELLLAVADEEGVVTVSRGPRREEVEGETVYRYTLALHADRIVPYVRTARERLQSEFGEDHIPLYTGSDEELAAEIDHKLIEYLNTNWPLSVWARADGTIARIGVDGRLVFPESLEVLQDQQFNLAAHLNLFDQNEPVVVSAPADALTLEEASERVPALQQFAPLLQMGSGMRQREATRSRGQVAVIELQLSNARTQAELYYNQNDFSYGGFCEEFRSSDPSLGFVCRDGDEFYRLYSSMLGDGEVFCVDSAGYAGRVQLQTIGDELCRGATGGGAAANTQWEAAQASRAFAVYQELPSGSSCGDGNDFIDGGGGIDTLQLAGAREEYEIERIDASSFLMRDTVACRNETDVVTNVERFQFRGEVVPAAQLLITSDSSAQSQPAPWPWREVFSAMTASLPDAWTQLGWW